MNSKQLLSEQRKGATILHNGAEVAYSPRRAGDRKPWAIEDRHQISRYSASQCIAYRIEEGERA